MTRGQSRAARVVLLSALAASVALAAAVVALTAGNGGLPNRGDGAAGGPWAAPYLYLGANGPPAAEVMKATGVRRFTVAFVVSDGTCNPVWDGGDRLTGGAADAAIRGIRAAGGEVAVSFGGMGGPKLGVTCSSPEALAGAYQKAIAAYRLRAVDMDLEDTEIGSPAVRQRVVTALALLRRRDPGLWISVTIGAEPGGPDAAGRDLISRAAAAGLRVNAWTIMPFDFPAPMADMGRASVQAAEGLKNALMGAYREPAEAAYQTMGISSMNGRTDTGETVTASDFQAIVRYARAHHLARLAFWSVNRDRQCAPGAAADSCSGIAQAPYAFTRVIAGYRG
jgi:chitinase